MEDAYDYILRYLGPKDQLKLSVVDKYNFLNIRTPLMKEYKIYIKYEFGDNKYIESPEEFPDASVASYLGCLNIIKWLHETGKLDDKKISKVAERANVANRLDILKYLHGKCLSCTDQSYLF